MKGNIKKPFYKRPLFIGLVVIVMLGSVGKKDDASENVETPAEIVETSAEIVEEEVIEIKRSDMNIDEYLAYMVNEVLGEKTNMDETTLVYVSDGDEGIKDIALKFNDNLTTNMVVDGMLMDATEYYKEISNDAEVMKLKGISLIYEAELVDKYGNETVRPVHIITLFTETMNKINWENFFFSNLPDIADTYFLHPALKE